VRASSLAAAILLGLFLAASAPLLRATQSGPRIACAPIEGAEALFAGAETSVILIDGLGDEAAAGAGALGCLAAAQGGLVLLAAEESMAGRLGPLARQLTADGGRARFTALGPGAPGGDRSPEDAQSEGEARAAGYEAALTAQSPGAAPTDHRIVALAAPDASRTPVGLTGFTWRPLGARLPDAETISLRAEASTRPGVRVKLRPFEDIPLVGATLRYDGIVEIGPATDAAP